MTFTMTLTRPSVQPLPKDVDELPDEFYSLVMSACRLLADTDCRFLVSGFGDDTWPVDIGYDLSTVVEQLPDLLTDLRAGRSGTLDFYGQGIQRMLEFLPTGSEIEIRCRSGTKWDPDPETEKTSVRSLEEIVARLAVDFAEALRGVSPALADLPPMPSWRRGDI